MTIGIRERFVRTFRRGFYPTLAVLFSFLVVADALYWHFASDMRQAAFGALVRNRIHVPSPDSSIVIVDIDEASLSAMAVDHGRWPWPRQVFGEFLEGLEAQKPRAIVFDMLFSDADLFNLESDSYFAEAVARTENTYFPFLRLDPSSDSLSHITPASIPGVRALTEHPDETATIAVVLPAFAAITTSGRMGLNNIYPDPDGVAREYLVYRNDHGWRVPSLPARVADALGHPVPDRERILLNWRGPPFTYRTVGFADVLADMQRREKRRPSDEFTGKIVLIGSTAASLFDAKPTPMSRIHPGVEILATAIDNLIHDDYLIPLTGQRFHIAASLLLVWVTALAFTLNAGKDRIDALFSASGLLLVAISFASLNFTRLYVDLTGPITMGLAYFTLARLYAASSDRFLERTALRRSREESADHRAILLLVDLGGISRAARARILRQARRTLVRGGGDFSGAGIRSAEILRGDQEGIWSLFEDHLAVSWMVATGDEGGHDRAMREGEQLAARLRGLLPAAVSGRMNHVIRAGAIAGGEGASASWRLLFAEGVIDLNARAPRESPGPS